MSDQQRIAEPETAATPSPARGQFIQGLRDLADFLDQHPAVPYPPYVQLNVFCQTKDEIAAVARAGGGWAKEYNGPWFYLKKTFGPDLELHIDIDREQVCRKVVIGTRHVDAQPAHDVEEVEWVCDELTLLATEGGRQWKS